MEEVELLPDESEKPPILSPENYYCPSGEEDDEEEDNFVEIDESDDENEEIIQEDASISTGIKFSIPQEASSSFITEGAQNIEENFEDDEYPQEIPKSKLNYAFDHSKYVVEYRDSQYRSKFRTKNTHKVAIVAKIDENMCLEFSYNRTSDFDQTKFYTCLGCRKAKVGTRMKDVVRTIKINKYRQIMSKGDPFMGHHFACAPLPWSPDARSYGHVLPQPMHMDLGEYAPSELVYIDEAAEPLWETSENSGLINLEAIPFYGEEGPSKKVIEEDTAIHPVSKLTSYYSRYRKKQKLTTTRKPKCHLCFAVLSSTEKMIEHLQEHLKIPRKRRKLPAST